MTEKSWLWDGKTTGDASLAAYAKEAFNRWFIAAKTNDVDTVAYILPGHLDDLIIEASAAQTFSSIIVKSGAAAIDGYIYELTEDTFFNIAQLSISSYRYDSLVLRVTRDSDPKVRLVLVNGDESNSYPPEPYTVVQEASGIWEIEVARVLIDSPAYTVDGTKLDVFTRYMPVAPHFVADPINLLINSEWLALSESGLLATFLEGPWFNQGAVIPTATAAAFLAPQTRGYSVNVVGGGFTAYKVFNGSQHNRITIEGTLQNNDASTRTSIDITYLRDSLTYSSVKRVDSIGFNTEAIHTFKRTFSVPEDTMFIIVSVNGDAVANDYNIGQLFVSPGYFTGGRRSYHEYIPLLHTIIDAAWDGDAKSTGTTVIDLTADFGGLVPLHVQGVVLTLRIRDSGSAGAANRFARILSFDGSTDYGGVYVDGLPNNYWITRQVTVFINQPFQSSLATTRGFQIDRSATGGSTMDMFVEIVGYIV